MKVKSYKDIARHFVNDLMGGAVVSKYGRFSFDQPAFRIFGDGNIFMECSIAINAFNSIDSSDKDPFDWETCVFYVKLDPNHYMFNKISMYKAMIRALRKFALKIKTHYLTNEHFTHLSQASESALSDYENLTEIRDGLLKQAFLLAKDLQQIKSNPIQLDPDNGFETNLLQKLLARTFSNWCEREWDEEDQGVDDFANPKRACFDLTYIHGFIKAIQLDENDMEKIQAQVKTGLGVK